MFTIINQKIIKIKVKETASENYLYELTNMTNNTREMLLRELSQLGSPLSNLIRTTVDAVFKLEELPNNFCHENPNMKESKRAIKVNIIEEYYTAIEELAAPSLNLIIEDKYERMNFDDYQNILRYAVNQLTRTPVVKEKFRADVSFALDGIDVDFQTYNVLQNLILSERIVLALIEKMYQVTLLNNIGNLNLITSDNPAINLNQITQKKDSKIFLPISPRKAIFIEPTSLNSDDQLKIKNTYLDGGSIEKYYICHRLLSEQDVRGLNEITASNKGRHIYGKESEDLECFKK